MRFWRVGRGSQASLPSLKTHNIPFLLPTTHLGAHLSFAHPPIHHFLCTIVAGPLPRPLNYHASRAPRVRLHLARHVTVAAASQRAWQSSQHSRASTVVLPVGLHMHTAALDAPVLSACTRAFSSFIELC
ncbi:hypothetical protein CC77DRAFT_1019114 [Alternaria alternata]|uniref:Uncharacterized protein n=1 Tax=Alternaria alternata TaxID=5599 RepID=A0A177DTK7_ALTAL|nr:hypothetical protein CC77DRAFT_1019114 [Alternaria alternata]OAG22109.1 hypothetical protein CC77DRAFT_1019114 [Alternaria alternata]